MESHILQAQRFCDGIYDAKVDGREWKSAFEYLIDNPHSFIFNKSKIHTLWTVNGGHLRRKVSEDDLILAILTMTLPKYKGDGLTLYRGECRFLYEDNKIGFCWTPNKNVASMFARGLNAIESGGALLKAYAPSHAILAEPNEHSAKQMQEFEYTCNPQLLENIQLIEFFPSQIILNISNFLLLSQKEVTKEKATLYRLFPTFLHTLWRQSKLAK